MGIFNFIKGGVRELAIARPDDAKGLMVYKHTDPTIPNKAQLTVGMDEVALFFKDGVFVGLLNAGRHTLESSNIMFLNRLVDSFTGGDVFKAEVWFVTTREMAGFKFGGRIGNVEDPKSKLAIETMVHGDYSMQVIDPVKLIGFYGQRSVAVDEEFNGWFRQQLLKTFRDAIASLLVEKKLPLLDVTSSALNGEIEKEVLQAVQSKVDSYGIRIAGIGNFVVSIQEKDAETLKGFYADAARIQMTGGLQGYQQYAAGKAMMGAGEGMAKGGDGGSAAVGAGLGVGVAMANMFSHQQGAPAQQPVSAPSLEDRLKKLKSLKDQGLIDDQEYAAKRAELLKDM